MTRGLFRGLSAFPLTPRGAEGRVDTDSLGRSLERLVAAGVDSVGLLGSTGGYAYLDLAERHRAAAAAIEAVDGRLPVMVGVSALRTDWTAELAREAERRGADALLVAPMSYTPLTQDEAFAHYQALTRASGLPVCVYNNPGTTNFVFSIALIARLSRLPGVAAIKMPLPENGDFHGEMATIRESAAPGLHVGYSGDWGAAAALLAGADAWYSVIAGLAPEHALRLTRAAQAGDVQLTETLHARFEPFWALFRAHGSLRVMYAMADLLDLSAGEPPRPLLPLSAEARRDVARALETLA